MRFNSKLTLSLNTKNNNFKVLKNVPTKYKHEVFVSQLPVIPRPGSQKPVAPSLYRILASANVKNVCQCPKLP